MKRILLSLTGALLALSGMAQSTMPWNPDANDDSYVGATDMLSTLAVYGQQIGIDSSLTCDYNSSDFEDFMAAVILGDVILDSVLVQYHVFDSDSVFVPGCPGPVADSVSVERVRWFHSFSQSSYPWSNGMQAVGGNGSYGNIYFAWNVSNNEFRIHMMDTELASLANDGFFDNAWRSLWTGTIPFDPEVSFDSSGASLTWSGYFNWATYVNMLPFWHYPE